jgi:hypothetical protein
MPPIALLFQPVGIYGISFDLRVHDIEDNLPHGWNIARSM